MRAKVTVFFGRDRRAITKETHNHDLPDLDYLVVDAQDYLIETILEPYSQQGYDLEDDEDDEDQIGGRLIAAWLLFEEFENREDALKFLETLLEEVEVALSEFEAQIDM